MKLGYLKSYRPLKKLELTFGWGYLGKRWRSLLMKGSPQRLSRQIKIKDQLYST